MTSGASSSGYQSRAIVLPSQTSQIVDSEAGSAVSGPTLAPSEAFSRQCAEVEQQKSACHSEFWRPSESSVGGMEASTDQERATQMTIDGIVGGPSYHQLLGRP
ncbi:hypothetical protein I317_02669 [Kwoniella heveanensis CBS 569]|uniref:Uncharacterized protein n=1 Tax=Kwoniella heveanensis BCC8398 TaxID=1296120 RepID=A0A1B9H170_9TREE|nr:hypothetical protein I316_00913 [Kwoniella heveanensis BCC8398]OCF43519.1 hypothetical protein I317_02669 [Kwoniella heveanensis CBS 569]